MITIDDSLFIKVKIENNGSSYTFSKGTTLQQVLMAVSLPNKENILAAFVDNYAMGLDHRVFKSHSIRFIYSDSDEGIRIYARSTFLILEKAFDELVGVSKLRIIHSVEKGVYFEHSHESSQQFADHLSQRMEEIISQDLPILKEETEYEKLLSFYMNKGLDDRAALLKTRPCFYVDTYSIEDYLYRGYGVMVPSTGYIKTFSIQTYGNGYILSFSKEAITNKPKLYQLLREYKEWMGALRIANIGDMNQLILGKQSRHIIMVGESLHEKRFSRIADKISARVKQNGTRIVLIAGPSSSGKTTFSLRLTTHLLVMGLFPVPISMDDYFLDREETPIGPDGKKDFESVRALDIDLFNSTISDLLAGKPVHLPKFDFISGKKSFSKDAITLSDDEILVIEGIHALNPILLNNIDPSRIFRIYTSALTLLSIDSGNIISTSDNRLLRRIIRDYNYRGRSAYETLQSWKSVTDGEAVNIFPYQETADEIVNTALIYEFSVLAPKIEPLLRMVPQNVPEYAEAYRLLTFLSYFIEIPTETIPPTSIIREFIGGSAFSY